jgi:adenylate cyclase, class 2
MKWEVEQKFRVSDRESVERLLTDAGASLGDPVSQADTYFNHPARDFRQTDEALRLRKAGDELFITYKGPRIDRQTKTRRELELPIAIGPAAWTQFAELLVALGFEPFATVQKKRRVANLAWQGFEVQVALDDVHGLGIFLELEIAADDESMRAAMSGLQSLSQQWGLGDHEPRSYLELLIHSTSKTLVTT